MQHAYDRSSKWLIQHFAQALLWLGGVREKIVSVRSLQTEVVQPRRSPDGLLEVQLAGRADPILFLVELATYPERRVPEQMLDDLILVYLDRRILPEMLTVVLHPKGQIQVPDTHAVQSALGWTGWQARWRVVPLWTLPAEELFAVNDVGLVPWVPLTHFSEPPQAVLQRCRERIDQQAPHNLRENLLAVIQVLARLRYNDLDLAGIFGGKQAMLELPFMKEIEQEIAEKSAAKAAIKTGQDFLLKVLQSRFGALPSAAAEELRAIQDQDKLERLSEHVALCPDLEAFREQLRS